MKIFDELAKPFPEKAIHWRIGARTKDKSKGIPLAYIDARDVMQRLDEVIGPFNWQDRYPFEGCCEIGILNEDAGEWIWKSNGVGKTIIRDEAREEEKTMKEKGQYSDAFKRAAVLWGIGRYLYDLPNTWLPLDSGGYKFLETPRLPAWATPNGWNRIPLSVKRELYKQTVDCLANGDAPGLEQIWDEFDTDEKAQLWGMFDSKQRSAMKAMKND